MDFSDGLQDVLPSPPAMGKPTAAELRAALRQHMRKLAAKGAKRGGTARMAALTPEERSALGRRAVAARWAKTKRTRPPK